ncbi:MAG TPA: hypothetical protein VJZ49_15450 [Syntrophales bacterium]|nr:hypothetical protein [Syntrophales bacterium]
MKKYNVRISWRSSHKRDKSNTRPTDPTGNGRVAEQSADELTWAMCLRDAVGGQKAIRGVKMLKQFIEWVGRKKETLPLMHTPGFLVPLWRWQQGSCDCLEEIVWIKMPGTRK